MKSFFTAEESKSIEAAILAAEKQTQSEFVVQVAKKSSFYIATHLAFVLFGMILGTVAFLYATSSSWDQNHIGIMELISIQAVCSLLALVFSFIPPFKRTLIPDSVETHAVNTQAQLAFLHSGVTQTRYRTGLLIFISRFERRVQIVADTGIHQKLATKDPDFWKNYSQKIAGAIRQKKTCSALCEVIQDLEQKLKTVLPALSENPDELSNHIRQ